jgi:ribosomal protein S18 acetylase RimI-like enzyme
VRVAERAGRVVGVGGYVLAPPWLFLWPVVADDGEAAGALIDAAIAAARGPDLERVRVSVRAIEPGKEAAVAARGFVRSIDFVEVVRAIDGPAGADRGGDAEPPAIAGVVRRKGAAIDRRAMHATHELAFATLANTAPMSRADFDHLLDGASAWPTATAGWFAADGTCAGFAIALRHPDHGVVEAIGTHPSWRRRGVGAVALAHVLATAAREGVPEVRAMIASDNPGSLGLHAAAGFRERARKHLWELALAR